MLWLADENFDNAVLRGLLRRRSTFAIIRAQDVGLSGSPDEEVLEWAAREGRVLLTQDVATITAFAYKRLLKGQRMPGVFEVARGCVFGELIEELLLIDECSVEGEWEGRIVFLPLPSFTPK